ncbi:MAG: 30S ribosomal protein S1 [Planctomycetota bacterium]|jgi:small subunit ribosomal protein S1
MDSSTGRSADTPTDLDAKLEAEIEAALGDMSLEDMLDPGAPAPRAGAEREKRIGTIASVQAKDVLVEFGPKAQGVCPIDFFPEPPTAGTKMEFIIDRYDEGEGLFILRLPGRVSKAEWESLEVGQIVEARCTGVNKGGLELEIAKHRAFMPAGQVDLRHIDELSVFIGELLPCEVLEVDRQRGRIILSRKAHLQAERAVAREKLLEDLEVGREMSAVVTSIQQYGAFADLGGIDGLIHVSDISYERIKHPSEKVKEGEQVQVKILKIDDQSDAGGQLRISLGMKQCLSDPSVAAFEEIRQGETVTGRITRIMPYGAFVEISPGVEGLIHISELSHERVGKVSAVVKPDEVITAKVLSVDRKSKRISLSLKAMQDQRSRDEFDRGEDPHMRKLKAQLSAKFGDNLKGGIG